MADLGEEAFSSQMKVVATFLRLLEELMRNKQQDLRYGTKTQRRGILGRMKDFVGGIFKKVYDGTFGRLSRNGIPLWYNTTIRQYNHGGNPMEKNTKPFALEDDPKIPEMPKSEDEQRRQNEDYARNLGLDVIDPIGG